MTNSEIFKAAHALAKQLNVKVGCYIIALKIALKNIYKAIKLGRSVDSVFSAMIRVCFGAEPIYFESNRTEYKAKTESEANRYIKETGANAGVVFERFGAFHFYVYK